MNDVVKIGFEILPNEFYIKKMEIILDINFKF